MSLRSILLRVLFWSLALAAICGALGILFASYVAIWRVSGTAILTTAAALLMLIASSKMDKPVSRPAALLAVTLIVIEYTLTLAVIWLPSYGYGYGYWYSIRNLLAEIGWFIFLVGLPAIAFLRMTTSKLTAWAGRVGLVLAALELALLLAECNWSGWSYPYPAYVRVAQELAVWLPLYALLTMICLIGQGLEPRRHWRWLGVAATAIGYVFIVFGSIRQQHDGGEVVVYLTCAAAAIAHANIVMLCPLRPGQLWLRWITIAAGTATALFSALTTYVGTPTYGGSGDTMPRLAAASAIFAGCGTLALAVLARLNKRFVVPPGAMSGASEITLVCPICRKKQTLALGKAQCVECRVLIQIRLEEPRCAMCEYSLFMLRSGVCPECGTPVPATPAPAIPPSPSA